MLLVEIVYLEAIVSFDGWLGQSNFQIRKIENWMWGLSQLCFVNGCIVPRECVQKQHSLCAQKLVDAETSADHREGMDKEAQTSSQSDAYFQGHFIDISTGKSYGLQGQTSTEPPEVHACCL